METKNFYNKTVFVLYRLSSLTRIAPTLIAFTAYYVRFLLEHLITYLYVISPDTKVDCYLEKSLDIESWPNIACYFADRTKSFCLSEHLIRDTDTEFDWIC